MQTKQDASYGIVPVRRVRGVYQVLLIHQISNLRGDSYWIIPKGHADPGETPLETATRELHEETGLTPTHVEEDHPFTLSYNFKYEGVRVNKTVTFFVGHIDPQASLVLQAAEVKDARWCTEHRAYRRVTHKSARTVLQSVFAYLSSTSQA